MLADSNLSVPEPTELRADVVTAYQGADRKIVTEVRKDAPGPVCPAGGQRSDAIGGLLCGSPTEARLSQPGSRLDASRD